MHDSGGALVSSDIEGNPLFLKANTGGKSIGSIEEGVSGVLQYTSKFDGTKRYNSYKAIGQSPGKSNKFEIAKDDNVPNSRMLTFSNPDTTEGDLKTAAEWQRSKTLADALTIPFVANGYYGPDGERWTENTIVTVVSEVISIPDGFDFLIQRCEFSSGGSKSTTLTLVPPQVYSGETIPDIFM